MKEFDENGRSVNGSNNILVEALGTPEYSGFIATSQEEQRRFQAEMLAKLSQVGVVTHHSDVSSSNMKQK